VAEALKDDPIARARELLHARGLTEQAERIEAEARQEIEAALAAASAAPVPQAADAYTDVVTIGEGAWK
jgi:pyruvate dehydrogenase E1 component alpha subunit